VDFSETTEESAFRLQARAVLERATALVGLEEPPTVEERLPRFQTFQAELHRRGFAGLSWPTEFGGRAAGLTEQAIFLEEYDRAGAPDRLNMLGEGLAGPTIIDFGSERQKADLLPPILAGEHIWCQLFSEPGAGSDLAALDARAQRDGDGWRITGQKVWTSRAQVADYGMLLARTGGPRHRGITYFLLPMRQEGVTIRPLRHMLGEAEFNEVFLDDALVPDDLRIGAVDDGWRVGMATLGYERVTLAMGRVNTQRLIADVLELVRDSRDAFGAPLGADTAVRRKVADFYARTAIHRVNGLRALASLERGTPGPESSIGKLFSGPLVEEIADFALSLGGLEGQLESLIAEPHDGRWLRLANQARGTSIAGGTTFIQRNIVAERVLGLPRR
jgi:alkylation response protein AidB-like acyl-CoA dehydrogenase